MGEIANQIVAEVGGWPGVKAGPHRFGGVEFRAAGHEIGHLHGDRLADLPFPVRVRRELVESGRALPHHVLPDSGWVSFRIGGLEDVAAAIALFRLNYERITADGPQAADASSAEESGVQTGEEPEMLIVDLTAAKGEEPRPAVAEGVQPDADQMQPA